jgi:streptogramin lyase
MARQHVGTGRAVSLLALGGILAIVAVAALDAVRKDSSEPAPAVEEIVPGELRVAASIPVERPAGVAVAGGSLWVASAAAGALVRIDPDRNDAVATILLDARPEYVAASGDRIYAVDEARQEALFIDPSTNAVDGSLRIGAPALGIAFVEGDAWVADAAGSSVARIDLGDGEILSRIPVPSPTRIAAGEEAVWALSPGDRSLARIDPRTNLLVATIRFPAVPEDVAVGEGAVWVSHPTAGSISRVDPETNEVAASIRLATGEAPLFIETGEGGVWVLSLASILRIDPETNAVDASVPLELGRHPGPEPLVLGGLAVGEGAAWVADTYSGEVLRVEPPG